MKTMPEMLYCKPKDYETACKILRSTEVGTKNDEEKLRLALVSPKIIIEIAKAMTYGAKNHGEYNYLKGIAYSRLYSALIGHLLAFWSGEEIDLASGLPHLSLAASELMMLMDMPSEHDDRHCKHLEGQHFEDRVPVDDNIDDLEGDFFYGVDELGKCFDVLPDREWNWGPEELTGEVTE